MAAKQILNPALALKPVALATFLANCIAHKEPVLIVGQPGIGKTDIGTQAAAQAAADFIVMHPVVSDPTDFKGMPWVNGNSATFLPFGDLQQLITATKLTVCFLDDIGQAPAAVQAALMQLVLTRQVNGHRVSDHVVFIAATNRRSDRAGVSGILEPLKSRFTIVELAPDLRQWSIWAASAGLSPVVVAFLQLMPAAFCEFAPTADMTNSPNPRNWHALSRLVQMGLPKDTQLAAYSGRVGETRAGEFLAFERTWASMVSPDLVLSAPDTAPIPTESSALYAISLAIAHKVNTSTMGRFCRYLDRVYKEGFGDFSAVSMQQAIARDSTLAATPAYVNAMAGPLGSMMLGQAS